MEIGCCSQHIIFSGVTVTVCITIHFSYRKKKATVNKVCVVTCIYTWYSFKRSDFVSFFFYYKMTNYVFTAFIMYIVLRSMIINDTFLSLMSTELSFLLKWT